MRAFFCSPCKHLMHRASEARRGAFTPHLFRKTLVDLVNEHCRTPEDFKAGAITLAMTMLTTFRSYGTFLRAGKRELDKAHVGRQDRGTRSHRGFLSCPSRDLAARASTTRTWSGFNRYACHGKFSTIASSSGGSRPRSSASFAMAFRVGETRRRRLCSVTPNSMASRCDATHG